MINLLEKNSVKDKIRYIELAHKKDKLILESILDPAQDKLNPMIWDENKKMKPEVRKQLLDMVLSKIKNPVHIFMFGSNTGYNYTPESDIDTHIQVQGSQDEADRLFNTFPKDFKIGSAPVQFYVYVGDEISGSQGKGAIYDLVNDKWIREPKKDELQIPYSYAIEVSKMFMSGIDNSIMEINADISEKKMYETLMNTAKEEEKKEIQERMKFKDEEIQAKLDSLHILSQMLWNERTNSYKVMDLDLFVNTGYGNYSISTMIYKILEKFQYRAKIVEMMKLKNKLMVGKPNDTQGTGQVTGTKV